MKILDILRQREYQEHPGPLEKTIIVFFDQPKKWM